MAQDTKIEWAHHTFNPWRGCTKVSDGCANCYADTLSKRNPLTLGVWGPNGTRVVAAEKAWREPLKWDRLAAEAGERHRVFCASLADVFEPWRGPMVDHKGNVIRLNRLTGKWGKWPGPSDEHQPLTMQGVRQRLFALIHQTYYHLDWLLLTKRPENITRFAECDFCQGPWKPPHKGTERCSCGGTRGLPRNVWIGTSVEDRSVLHRIDTLRTIPAKVRFLSIEPLLDDLGELDLTGIHWVTIGGESGHHARPCNIEHVRSIVRQCKAAGVLTFVKQVGSWPTGGLAGEWVAVGARMRGRGGVTLWDKKGGDPLEWPDDLRVREVPG